MKRRLLIIVLALILAAVGTGGVVSSVKNANARAIAGGKAVSALVAQRTIPSGPTAQAALRTGLLANEALPASSSALSPSSSSSGQSATLVTLAANQAEAEQLIQLTETGVPYLALLSPNSRTTADIGSLLSARPRSAPVPVLTFPVVTPSAAP